MHTCTEVLGTLLDEAEAKSKGKVREIAFPVSEARPGRSGHTWSEHRFFGVSGGRQAFFWLSFSFFVGGVCGDVGGGLLQGGSWAVYVLVRKWMPCFEFCRWIAQSNSGVACYQVMIQQDLRTWSWNHLRTWHSCSACLLPRGSSATRSPESPREAAAGGLGHVMSLLVAIAPM